MPTVATGTPDPGGEEPKAEVFFTRAAKVAGVGSFDYAIEMYMQGLAIAPHHLDGHKALRRVGIERRLSGGGRLDVFQTTKLDMPGRTPQDDLLASAKLLAYDPENLDYVRRMLAAATALGMTDVADWLSGLLRPSSDVG
jgi:hypothetical protein